jgi:signal transduction histidine kinase/ActR/RegA family two-component response regulator
MKTHACNLFALIATALAALMLAPTAQANADTLRVGIYQNPPKIFRDDQGRPAGFWPELVDGVFAELGHEAVWVDCEWARCLELLEAGEIDIMPDVAFSNERAERFAFADHPVLYSWSTILLAGETRVDALEDLAGLRVAVVENSIQARNFATLVADVRLEARLVETASMEDAALALTTGAADAALMNSFFARDQLDQPGVRAASFPFGVSTLHLALSPQMPASLSEALNIAIYQQQIDPDSAFSAAQQRWITEVDPAIPPWIWRTLIIGAALVMFSIILNFSLRHLVRQRTAKLQETVQSLELEMSHRRRAEAQLIESQKIESLGRLVGGVAHDFNNLLAVIMGNLEILRLTKRDGDEAEMLDDALTASQRGATLTKQLLSFGRKASLRPEVIDVNTVLSSLDHLMRRVIPATIEVDFVRATSLWPAALDAAQLESALLNLAINARDAMPHGGRITVETANFDLQAEDGPDAVAGLAPGNYVRVSVADTGAGMTDEVRSRAIEPFFTTKPVGKGSGMGLAMVHGFAEQSGGALEISSTPGQGTTIRLYFPVAHGAPTEDREQPRVRPQRASEHILLVEDEDPVRHTLARQLRLIGYTVTEATNGRAALAALEQSDAIDLMLTDIVMPGDLQGPALARRVRERFPGVPIIFMSGYPREEALRQNGLSDEDVLLMKPVQYDDLLSALRLNLKNRKAG